MFRKQIGSAERAKLHLALSKLLANFVEGVLSKGVLVLGHAHHVFVHPCYKLIGGVLRSSCEGLLGEVVPHEYVAFERGVCHRDARDSLYFTVNLVFFSEFYSFEKIISIKEKK